jgi:DNA-directed RNA polymerase specialized sigma24 family protein
MIDSTPWVDRPHPGPRAERLALTQAEREQVEALLRCGTTPLREARRAQALLLMADGVGPGDIAQLVGVHERTVLAWRSHFKKASSPVDELADAPRSGRPPSLSPRPRRRRSSPKRASRRVT